jgi:hypothetical protein
VKIPPRLTGLALAASVHVLPVFIRLAQSLAPPAVTTADAGSTATITFANSNSVSTATKTEQFVGINPGEKVSVHLQFIVPAPATCQQLSGKLLMRLPVV